MRKSLIYLGAATLAALALGACHKPQDGGGSSAAPASEASASDAAAASAAPASEASSAPASSSAQSAITSNGRGDPTRQ